MTLTYVVPAEPRPPASAELVAAVINAFKRAPGRAPERPVGAVRSAVEMRANAGSRSLSSEEDARFDQLFAELPTDDEG
jgi:hypothetical protein